MAAITQSHFNWLPQPSMWQQTQNWAASQADIQAAADTTTAILGQFTNVNTNKINGLGSLAAQAALARIQKATAVKQAQQQAKADLAARNAPPPSTAAKDVTLSDGSIVKAPPLTLAGGTKINAADGTLTLADGTVLNIKTGLKVNVTA